jgi:hypothetical protein
MVRRPRVVVEGGWYHVYNRVSSGDPDFAATLDELDRLLAASTASTG